MTRARPKTDLDAMRQDLHAIYDGDPWHGASITAVLDGVNAEMAARRSIPGAHTIWELVLHMTAWTREVASRVRGAEAKSPPEDWPPPRFGGGEPDWVAARRELASAQQELENAVAELKPADLTRWVGDQRDASLGSGLPVGSVIRGLLQHHTYHEGQISLLKRVAELAAK